MDCNYHGIWVSIQNWLTPNEYKICLNCELRVNSGFKLMEGK